MSCFPDTPKEKKIRMIINIYYPKHLTTTPEMNLLLDKGDTLSEQLDDVRDELDHYRGNSRFYHLIDEAQERRFEILRQLSTIDGEYRRLQLEANPKLREFWKRLEQVEKDNEMY